MFRELKSEDYINYLILLKQLNNMDITISKEEFIQEYQLMKQTNSVIYVYEKYNKILATAKLLYEVKFYDNIVHIEDVVVDSNFRNIGLGKKMIQYIIDISPPNYKIVLQGDNEFYEKCGFTIEGKNYCKRN